MKKISAILLLIMAVAFTGCNKERLITLSTTSTTLHHGETYKISAQCDDPITYTSSNEYYAKVSSLGKITAQYVGKTTISLKSEDDNRIFTVTIAPEYNLYPEPNINIGETKSSVISKLGTPDAITDGGIGYNNYSDAAPILMVLLDNNDRVQGYSVFVKTIYSSTLSSFLGERYVFLGYSDDTFMYTNGLTESTATKYIASRYYNTNYWWVIYGNSSSNNCNKNNVSDSMNSYNEIRFMDFMKLIEN